MNYGYHLSLKKKEDKNLGQDFKLNTFKANYIVLLFSFYHKMLLSNHWTL